MTEQFESKWRQIREKTGGYPSEAYHFIREGLGHTVKLLHGETAEADDESRHVSGQQLCLGLRDYAQTRYGLLARTVLNRWGICSTQDFGTMVFAMVEAGLMRKTEEDTLGDFTGVFDFDEAFATPQKIA